AGSSYVYCPSMQMVTDAPCCAGDGHRAHDSELRRRDCCEQHVLAKLPPVGTTVHAPQPFAAPLVATLPAPSSSDTSSSLVAPGARSERECRAGPLARALARHRAELMVALN